MPWGFKYHDVDRSTDWDPFHLKPIDVQPPGVFETILALLGYLAIIAGLIWLIF